MSKESPNLSGAPQEQRQLQLVLTRNSQEELTAVVREKQTPSYLASNLNKYQQRMRIGEELDELAMVFPEPIIWDVGAGSADAICKLNDIYKNRAFRFIAINPHFLPTRFRPQATVPLILASTEQLANKVARQARKLDLYPPSALILSNSLMYSHFGSIPNADLLKLALLNISAVTPKKSWVFIYEDGGEVLYEKYIQKINILKLPFDTEEEPGNGFCKSYLKLVKH